MGEINKIIQRDPKPVKLFIAAALPTHKNKLAQNRVTIFYRKQRTMDTSIVVNILFSFLFLYVVMRMWGNRRTARAEKKNICAGESEEKDRGRKNNENRPTLGECRDTSLNHRRAISPGIGHPQGPDPARRGTASTRQVAPRGGPHSPAGTGDNTEEGENEKRAPLVTLFIEDLKGGDVKAIAQCMNDAPRVQDGGDGRRIYYMACREALKIAAGLGGDVAYHATATAEVIKKDITPSVGPPYPGKRIEVASHETPAPPRRSTPEASTEARKNDRLQPDREVIGLGKGKCGGHYKIYRPDRTQTAGARFATVAMRIKEAAKNGKARIVKFIIGG